MRAVIYASVVSTDSVSFNTRPTGTGGVISRVGYVGLFSCRPAVQLYLGVESYRLPLRAHLQREDTLG
jgi:hypothetical protein